MALSPRDQRHQYLRFEGLEYTDADIIYFEERLGISSDGDFFGTTLSYTSIRDPMLRLGVDVGSVNIPYLLARYLRLFSSRKKRGAMISEGQFIARLAEHFGLLTEERLQGLTVIVRDLLENDMAELVRLQICKELDDTWAWVALRAAEVMDAMARDLSRFTMWAAGGISQLLDSAGATYVRYSETRVPYQRRRVRQRTGDASTSTAQQDEQQPDL
ncbi:hypothetical protein Tco_0601833 [Tanacetum coccineum]